MYIESVSSNLISLYNYVVLAANALSIVYIYPKQISENIAFAASLIQVFPIVITPAIRFFFIEKLRYEK